MTSVVGVCAAIGSEPSINGKIAFNTDRNGNNEIYVMNADGSNQTRLTNNAASDGDPSWSPDGTRIAFNSQRDGNYEIYIMNADGSGQTRLTGSSYGNASKKHRDLKQVPGLQGQECGERRVQVPPEAPQCRGCDYPNRF